MEDRSIQDVHGQVPASVIGVVVIAATGGDRRIGRLQPRERTGHSRVL
jgi:hypothetical protein